MEYEHEEALADCSLTYNDLPLNIKGSINNWKRLKKKVDDAGDQASPADKTYLAAESGRIADMIQDHAERDYEDENQNQNNMLTEDQKAKATQLGLNPETATVADIENAEADAKKKAEEEEAAAAAKKKAEEEEAAGKTAAKKKEEEEAAATAAAKKKAEEEVAAKNKKTTSRGTIGELMDDDNLDF